MKKCLLAALFLFLAMNAVFADETKDELYYKRQIQNQRLPYSEAGMVNAIMKGQADVLETYVKAGFSPNTSYVGTPMVIFAIYKNQPECTKVLLENGADPNTTIPAMFVTPKSTNALVYSIQKKDSESAKYLIEHKADLNQKLHGMLPLDYAIKAKQTKIAEMLLKAGAKPDENTLKLVNKSKDEYLKDLFKEY